MSHNNEKQKENLVHKERQVDFLERLKKEEKSAKQARLNLAPMKTKGAEKICLLIALKARDIPTPDWKKAKMSPTTYWSRMKCTSLTIGEKGFPCMLAYLPGGQLSCLKEGRIFRVRKTLSLGTWASITMPSN